MRLMSICFKRRGCLVGKKACLRNRVVKGDIISWEASHILQAQLLLRENICAGSFSSSSSSSLVGNKNRQRRKPAAVEIRPNYSQNIIATVWRSKNKSTRRSVALQKKNQGYLFNDSRMKNWRLRSHACWFKSRRGCRSSMAEKSLLGGGGLYHVTRPTCLVD